ncbi:MAG: PP2C family protein-serine/threonine phosphatase, partial [Acidimicrobiales bacterium]
MVGLLVVGVLTWTSRAVYTHTENRLLDLKAKEAASVLNASLPVIQTPLGSAAELADATNGDPQEFARLMQPLVGPGRTFVSASLWPLGSPQPSPVATVGALPALAEQPALATAFFSRAAQSGQLNVTGILGNQNPRLGYEFNSPRPTRRFAAYAESALPPSRRSVLGRNAAFSDLNFALYLGRSERPADLLATSITPVPTKGTVVVVPFGDSAFTLIVTPKGILSGTLPARLPWLIAVFGALLALAAAVTSERLVRRRRHAELLAGALDHVAAENRRLYTEQHTIAQTLQHALLPEKLPDLRGVDACSRYVPGVRGIEVGGDWYDLIAIDERRALFVVGDVSGRGLDAAVVMASLRYAIRAYAAQGDSP